MVCVKIGERYCPYANSLALNVQISYLRRALRNDNTVRIDSLMRKGYMLREDF